jgi:hypothetical protein
MMEPQMSVVLGLRMLSLSLNWLFQLLN